jgi:hypothetical protein
MEVLTQVVVLEICLQQCLTHSVQKHKEWSGAIIIPTIPLRHDLSVS